MIDRALQEDLGKLRVQIQNCLSIYADEFQRRKNHAQSSVVALSPDSTVIYGYLHPRAERDFCSAAVEALMQTDAVLTLILPGVREEIERIYQRELTALSQPLYRPQINPSEATTPDLKREVLDQLKWDVAVICDKLNAARVAVDRLSRFLSSRCLDRANWDGIDAGVFEASQIDFEEIHAELSSRRVQRSTQASMVDCMNLASLMSAANSGLYVPLVTDTHALIEIGRAVGKCVAELLIGPFTAVTIVSLAKASTQDISRLKTRASTLLGMMDPKSKEGEIDLLTEFNEYMEATFNLAELGALLNRTWSQPSEDVPDELNLRALAREALRQVEILARKIAEISRRFGIRPEESENSRRGAADNIGLLSDIVTGDESIIINKLIVLHEGAQMTEYNINQTGNNLTAIVDSFKTAQLIGSGLSSDIETQMRALLDGILNSKLPEEEKKDVVEATTKVVEDVKKEGHLTGTAKMLWGGIRETIKSVPAALTAWEAIQKHWH